MTLLKRGDIWVTALDPAKGSEIRKTRPCLIISRTEHNEKTNTVTIIPITSGAIRYPAWEIEIGKSSGLDHASHMVIPQIRIAAKERLKKRLGHIPSSLWPEIEEKLLFYLGCDRFLQKQFLLGGFSLS